MVSFGTYMSRQVVGLPEHMSGHESPTRTLSQLHAHIVFLHYGQAIAMDSKHNLEGFLFSHYLPLLLLFTISLHGMEILHYYPIIPSKVRPAFL
jgi:hypothetical protein